MLFINHPYRFTREQRLLANDDFGKVIKNACFKTGSSRMAVLAIANDLDYARVGIIVGKKKVRKANKRNRIKRVTRESFRFNQANLKGLDIVVIAKQGIDQLTNSNIRECLDKLWKNLITQFNR